MAKIVVNPASELAPRPGDELLTAEELERLDLFRGFKKIPSFEKFPGAVLLRRYRAGEVLFRQGDPGTTAFYILKSEDALNHVRAKQAAALAEFERPQSASKPETRELLARIEDLTDLVSNFELRLAASMDVRPDGQPGRRAATAYLFVDTGRQPRRRGMLDGWFGGERTPETRPEFIPHDGPTDIDYETKQAPMYEGDVFGEMSCMTLAPRSATVVADADCFMLEFLRNIFDAMQRDAGYRQRIDANYRERVLKRDLRRLEVFRDVSDADLEHVRDRCELAVVDPGQIICDEHDESDAVYVVRGGLVQIVADLNLTLHPKEIADWPAFCRELLSGAEETT